MTSELVGPDLHREGISWDELADGAPRLAHAGGDAILVVRLGGEAFAVGATCTHYSGPLVDGVIVGATVRCPWHHACFDLRTGEALRAPALNALPCWPVVRREGRLFVGAKSERDPLAPFAGAMPAVTPSSVVIVGAGAAGAAAAEMLRRRGYAGPVTLIDSDPSAPVDRPNLSKDYLAGHAEAEWIPLRPHGFYDEHRITLRLARVAAIDAAARVVRLDDGDTIGYGALMLAMGSEPRRLTVPGAEAAHVHTLRSLADADRIIAGARGARQVVVIGSSFIGLEVAASLRERGLEVHVVSPDTRPLDHVLGSELATMVQSLHEQHGVTFHLPATVARIEAKAVVLEGGASIPADLVVAGIGVTPRVALAEAADLRVDHGVLVDQYLATSAPGIWAAGDIARWPDAHTGRPLRIEHWVVAERQGQTAAENILGARRRFDAVPFFWSQHYDVRIDYVGYSLPWERVDVTGDLAARRGTVAYRARGATVGVASVGDDRRCLDAEVALERNDEATLTRLVPPA